ncbi:MAG: YqeG family HAD IIIA-type phosphatase [Synechococcaceae cyanobacterium RL_1_2]|nr:YqeG family HAD IIIA-type phosphatase [Synechococcaceae cyanobacterium RL_1_2]
MKLLQPSLVLGDNILGLTPDILKTNGVAGLILDVDETLVPFGVRATPPELLQWSDSMKSHFPIWLVSNNLSEDRIGSIAKALDLPYFLGASKPSRRKLKAAAQEMDLPFEQVAMVGDRLFTDVVAGNRLGMFTVLVQPMGHNRLFGIRSFEFWLAKTLGAEWD